MKNDDTFSIKGRILALDLGEKRIGVAVSDATRTIAQPLDVFQRTSRKADFETIGRFVQEQQANMLLVGLPLLLNGTVGEKAAWVQHYSAELQQTLDMPLELWDESFTTIQAEASLKARGKKKHKIRENVDAVAASFILQSYLDSLAW
jgi:putative Holliday junction resolvase